MGWLYRRFEHSDQRVRDCTPRRLVYCLPVGALVEQTAGRVEGWLGNLGMEAQVGVVTLTGGDPDTPWHLYPERPFIVIGAQEMLLSRALNRGYGSSPFKWPVEYGLLNNDCCWVMDEPGLMTAGLPTSTQLAGLRRKLATFGPVHSMWMSATTKPEQLATVDHPAPSTDEVVELGPDDMADSELVKRCEARKVVTEARLRGNNRVRTLAALIEEVHVPGALTLAVVNMVERAQQVYLELCSRRTLPDAKLELVHSRFREYDRRDKQRTITAPIEQGGAGMVVVSTRAVEAGMDISARTLVVELAPWPSMVQRFGRCNRYGEHETARIFWLDVGERVQDGAPYRLEDVAIARDRMKSLEGRSVGPFDLEKLDDITREADHLPVIRRRDVLGLFDTTPDLSGNYLDVSQFVSGTDGRDVTVFWLAIPPEGPYGTRPRRPSCVETVSVPVGGGLEGPGGIRDYLANGGRKAWIWDILDDQWREVWGREICPGMSLMLDSALGGYSPEVGWDPADNCPVPVLPPSSDYEDGYGTDPWSTSARKPTPLSEHCRNVEEEARSILDGLPGRDMEPRVRRAVELAALYHDAGKGHPAFQRMMLDIPESQSSPDDSIPLAKSDSNRQNERRHFRHEIGSALAILEHGSGLDDTTLDLAAYLAAAHHGKVRMAMKPLPGRGDRNPEPGRLLGYEVPHPEILPAVDLGHGLRIGETVLDLSIAGTGLEVETGRRSWLDRTTALLDWLGPFRLAFLEAIVRAADMRAKREEQGA